MSKSKRQMILTPHHMASLPMVGGSLVLDFVNTVDHWNAGYFKEYLATAEDWEDWLKIQGLLSTQLTDVQAAEKIGHIRDTRNRTFSFLLNYLEQRPIADSEMDHINGCIGNANINRILVVKGTSMEVLWKSSGSDAISFLHPIFKSLETLLLDIPKRRLKQCPECGWLFYDHSKSQTRKWCDMKYCGSRTKSRNYYHRNKDQYGEMQ